MIPWLFTTGWGLLYLAVLVLLMGPALLRAERRWLAAAMFLLFVLDRLAVNALPQELALFFLAFAYTLVAFAVTITHLGRAAEAGWRRPARHIDCPHCGRLRAYRLGYCRNNPGAMRPHRDGLHNLG